MNLLGIKYPASRIMGGSMNKKNTSGVRVEGGCSEVRNSRNPKYLDIRNSRNPKYLEVRNNRNPKYLDIRNSRNPIYLEFSQEQQKP